MGDSSQVSSYYTPHGKENMPFIMLWLLSRELKGDIMRFWQFYWSMLYFEGGGECIMITALMMTSTVCGASWKRNTQTWWNP